MTEPRPERRLAAILAADVVGYSALVEQNEAGTLAQLAALRNGVIAVLLRRRIVVGWSSCSATACSRNSRAWLTRWRAPWPSRAATRADCRLQIGVNLGDVVVEGGDLYGDEVNVAARLEGLAGPGGIVVSGTVPRPSPWSARSCLPRIGRAAAEEHRPPGPRLPASAGTVVGRSRRRPRRASARGSPCCRSTISAATRSRPISATD